MKKNMFKKTGILFFTLIMSMQLLFPVSARTDDICEISIENVTLMKKNTDIEEIEELANAITVPSIGCRIRIKDCPIPEHADLMHKIQAGIDQVDIVETGLTTSMSSLVSSDMLLPLEMLLDSYAKELKDKEGKLLQATTMNGHIYAVPAGLYCGRADGIGYNAEIAEKYGITVEEPVTLETLTQIGKILKNTDSGIFLTTQGDGSLTLFDSLFETEVFSRNYAYGVIIDPQNNTDIVNLFETDEYRNYLKVIRNWYEMGMIPNDSLFSGRNGQDMFNHAEVFFQFSSVSPQTQIAAVKKGLPFEEKYVPVVRNRLTTNQVQEFAWGITRSCDNPEKAMQLLNLIYTDPELANILQFGIEGKHYEVTDSNIIRNLADPEGPGGYSTYFSIFGDSAEMYRYETDASVSFDDIKKFTSESEPVITFGYVFRPDAVNEYVIQVNKVIDRYMPVLETGMADDTDAMLDEFITELKGAGIDKIISENQKQLDEWMSKK